MFAAHRLGPMSVARLILLTLALLPSTLSLAAPPVLEETTRIVPPEPDYFWIPPASTSMLAVDGDRIIAAAHKPYVVDDPQAVYILERASNGTWTPTRIFTKTTPLSESTRVITVDLKGNVAAVVSENRLYVFERGAGGWTQTANLLLQGGNQGPDVAVGNGFIVVGSTALMSGVLRSVGLVYRKNTAGQWSYLQSLVANPTGGFSHETYAANVELSGNSVLLTHYQAIGVEAIVTAHLFEGTPGAWTRTALLTEPANFKPLTWTAFDGNYILISGAPTIGPSKTGLFVRSGGNWVFDTSPTQIGSSEQVRVDMTDIAGLGAAGGTALIGLYTDEDRGSEGGSIMVYKRGVNGVAGYQPIAKLMASDATQQLGLGRAVELSGNRIVSVPADGTKLYVFQLPTTLSQPELLQDDFEDNNSVGWLHTPSNAWSVVAGTGSRVYRQNNLAAEAVSTRSSVDWTNQSIEAYIKPTAVSGADRWFGLFVRQSDANNYYYATVRTSNVVQIKKIVNGAFITLASAPLTVSLSRTYKVRMEAVGTWLRVYVDGNLVAQARDSSLTHGLAGLRTYRVAADYDNVVISPNPLGWMFRDTFDIFVDPEAPQEFRERRQWLPTGSGNWTVNDDTDTFVQTSSAADARNIAGVAVDDLVIETKLKAVSFNGSDRWFGLLTRYQNDSNYYYVTLRSSNQISLRRLINGAITVLDTAPLTVTPGIWFNIRMENIDTALRVYVNNQLVLEANDTTFTKGRYGLATYRTSAEYDDFFVRQP
ncbi:hypothetical protein [Steroidobacter sp.]|uniref:hypothetical protein n=1 Tax=Steroidobacter sp. TaxID=1978227 RepID=UPI001A507C9E|nr:hypothetical protein [Steroidobacter sp.]MBL8268843.1 hypothetical protein [Steroidobacter sp.]